MAGVATACAAQQAGVAAAVFEATATQWQMRSRKPAGSTRPGRQSSSTSNVAKDRIALPQQQAGSSVMRACQAKGGRQLSLAEAATATPPWSLAAAETSDGGDGARSRP